MVSNFVKREKLCSFKVCDFLVQPFQSSSVVDERVNADEEMEAHRMNLKKPIHNPWKILEWEMVDQVLIDLAIMGK